MMAETRRRHVLRRVVLIVLVALLVFYLVGGWMFSSMIYSETFSRNDTNRSMLFMPNLDYQDISHIRYPRSEFRFASGKNELAGFEYGAANTRGLVVISSGSGGTGDDYMNFVTSFVDDGYRVITYDMTGAARSGGDGQRGLYQGALDVDALLVYIEAQSEYDGLPVYLLGHSWGGYGVCAALVKPHRVNAVVSIAGYNDGAEMFAAQGETMGAEYYLLRPFLWLIQKTTFGAAMDTTAIDGINAADIPVLVIQGSNDADISVDGVSIYAHQDAVTNSRIERLFDQAR
jgi:pimeloyl-ACP methyl ester carboxylesterase